jgi:hypothetical protein
MRIKSGRILGMVNLSHRETVRGISAWIKTA